MSAGGRIARRAVVRGYVQGVFFRQSTADVAGRLGIDGWVRNRPEGTVELHAEGEPAAVEELLEFARSGPPGARVDGVDVADTQVEGLQGFRVR